MRFTVEKLGKQEGREYIKSNHYSGGCSNAAMIWGLYDTFQELRGAVAFAVPISEKMRKQFLGGSECWCDHIAEDHGFHQHVIDLHRLYTDDELRDGAESWFISQALDELKSYKPKYWIVTAFADTTEGHLGTVYQASNALYYGTTDESMFYRDEDGVLRHPRQCGENITKAEAEKRGWKAEYRDSKHRYLFVLPDGKRHREWLNEEIRVEFLDYPTDSITKLA